MRQLIFLIVLIVFAPACEDPPAPKAPAHQVERPELKPWSAPKALDMLNAPKVELELGESLRFDSCNEIFEPDSRVAKTLPIEPGELLVTALACDAEATLETDAGTIVAWATPVLSAGHRDLRVASWDKDGKYLWSLTIDRSREGSSFVANFRESFLVELEDQHICAGSLYEGGTQATCVHPGTGEVHWSGRMPFWSGMLPAGIEGRFLIADLTGISQRYPFSGVEMRFSPLDAAGGRSAIYLRDESTLFFAPPRTEEPRVIRYDLKSMKAMWGAALPEDPTPGYGLASEKLDIVVIRLDDEIVALDATSAEPLWALAVSDDRPSLAASDEFLYVLYRRPEQDNLLLAIKRSGEILWKAEVSAGILSVHTDTQGILLRSVRAVQRAKIKSNP